MAEILLCFVVILLWLIFRQLQVIAHNQVAQCEQAYILSRKVDKNA